MHACPETNTSLIMTESDSPESFSSLQNGRFRCRAVKDAFSEKDTCTCYGTRELDAVAYGEVLKGASTDAREHLCVRAQLVAVFTKARSVATGWARSAQRS